MSASKRDPKCLFWQQNIQLFYCLYKQNEKIQKLSDRVTTKEKDKVQAAPMSCVNKVMIHSTDKISQTISNVYIVSGGSAAQFHLRFVFNFLIFFQIFFKMCSQIGIITKPTMNTMPPKTQLLIKTKFMYLASLICFVLLFIFSAICL